MPDGDQWSARITRRDSVSFIVKIGDFRRQTQRFAEDRDEQVTRATQAVFAATQYRAEELAEALGQLKRENEASE